MLPTSQPGPNPLQDRTKEGLGHMLPQTMTGPDRLDLARSYLTLAGDAHREAMAQLEDAAFKRAHFANLARREGVTFREIADHYGITEGAVRQMLKRVQK